VEINLYGDSIQLTCVSLKFAYRCASPILVEIGETGGNLAITAGTDAQFVFNKRATRA
jgi:hypothetical protein